MLNKTLLSLISLLPLFALESVTAAPTATPPGIVIPIKKVCKIAQAAETENPDAVEKDTIVGTVYGVTGNIVMVELDGGGTKHVSLDRREVGHIGQLVGRRVTITPFFCKRINLTPRAVVTPPAIEVPKIESRPPAPIETPAPTPAPVETPAPIETPVPTPSPTIIPQTW
jgi:cell division septation protein DedD